MVYVVPVQFVPAPVAAVVLAFALGTHLASGMGSAGLGNAGTTVVVVDSTKSRTHFVVETVTLGFPL